MHDLPATVTNEKLVFVLKTNCACTLVHARKPTVRALWSKQRMILVFFLVDSRQSTIRILPLSIKLYTKNSHYVSCWEMTIIIFNAYNQKIFFLRQLQIEWPRTGRTSWLICNSVRRARIHEFWIQFFKNKILYSNELNTIFNIRLYQTTFHCICRNEIECRIRWMEKLLKNVIFHQCKGLIVPGDHVFKYHHVQGWIAIKQK